MISFTIYYKAHGVMEMVGIMLVICIYHPILDRVFVTSRKHRKYIIFDPYIRLFQVAEWSQLLFMNNNAYSACVHLTYARDDIEWTNSQNIPISTE